MRLTMIVLAVVALGITPAAAQTYDALTPEVREFVSVGGPLIALTHVQLIDGTGSAPFQDHTIVIADGRVQTVGPTGGVAIPSGADVHDLTGHTVIPGIVGMHNHTFYRGVRGTPGETTAQLDVSSPRLYLANGVTTVRTTGSISPYSELNVKHQIDSGEAPGPRMYVTGPYFDGEGAPVSRYQPASPEDAKRVVRYWVEEGVTWFKAYANIKGENLKAIIDEAHRLGAKVTGHLCSVTFGEAMELEIDNLEHGFLTASDFEVDKPQDVCPAGFIQRLADVDVEGPEAQDLIQDLVRSGTPITSTLSAYEFLFVPGGRPIEERVLEMMPPQLSEWYVLAHAALLEREREFRADPEVGEDDPWPFSQVFWNAQAFERSFVDQGGLLVAGHGSVLPGPPRIRRSAQLPTSLCVGVLPVAGRADHVGERRQSPRRPGLVRHDHRGQVGRSRGHRRRPDERSGRHPERQDRLQGRCGIRSGEAVGLGAWDRRPSVGLYPAEAEARFGDEM